MFGSAWLWGSIVGNVVIGALTASLLTIAVLAYLERRAGKGAACSVGATVALGFATFGCPSCYVPLLGTLGVSALANALPLLGIEFKIASVVVLLGTLAWQLRRGRRPGIVDYPIVSDVGQPHQVMTT